MKSNNSKIEILITSLTLVVITLLILSIYSPVYFHANDDGIISGLANGEYTGKVSIELIYGSKIYGSLLAFLYYILPMFQWHGILILLIVFLSSVILLLEVSKIQKFSILYRAGIYLIVINSYLIFVISPTFTKAALISGMTGAFLIYKNLITQNHKFIIPGLLLFISVIIRPDGFAAVLYLIFPAILQIFYLYLKNKKLLLTYISLFIPSVLVFVQESYLTNIFGSLPNTWKNYWQFLNAFHQIHTNPSMLKMHQEIAAFQIPGLNWTNVEATLLTTVTYFDPTVFNPSQMELAKNHVNDFIGVRGLMNSEFLVTLSRIWEYMVQINYLFYALIGIIIFLLFIIKKMRQRIMIICFILYIFLFHYYLGAVWRIPARINMPIFFMLIISFLILIPYFKVKSTRNVWLISVISSVLVIIFQFQPNGFIGIKENLLRKQGEQEAISNELKRVNENGIFIGHIKYGQENYTNAYTTKSNYRSLDLTSGWHVFSPPWNQKAKSLGISDANPTFSFTNKKDVYFVGDAYISEVMGMFLNDRKLYVQGICTLGDLPNGGKIISYQITESQCKK
jgi:hypothetical protein